MGSVFSPTYFAARARDPRASPSEHCAINAVLYRRGGKRWAFTEPTSDTVERRPDTFAVSGSQVRREHGALLVELDERSTGLGLGLRGRVRIELHAGTQAPRALDRAGDHHWWPVGALATAEVELDQPNLRFRGSAYHDCNFGSVPLEDTFESWNWSRAQRDEGVEILYDVVERGERPRPLALRLEQRRGLVPWEAPRVQALPTAHWGVARSTRGARDGSAKVIRTLEDTPFYTRSLLQLDGAPAVHESLDLQRFTKPWVQFLLPFRLRRGWRA